MEIIEEEEENTAGRICVSPNRTPKGQRRPSVEPVIVIHDVGSEDEDEGQEHLQAPVGLTLKTLFRRTGRVDRGRAVGISP